MGMLQAGMLSRLVARWLGLSNVRTFTTRFTGQVWPGDTLTLAGRVEGVREDAGVRVADCAFTVTRQNGDEVIRARATATIAATGYTNAR